MFSETALAFPGTGDRPIVSATFRNKVWKRVLRKAVGKERHLTPHSLRHTWASLHLAEGNPIKWVQAQGGWQNASLLLDLYGHYMPTKSSGLAEAVAQRSVA